MTNKVEEIARGIVNEFANNIYPGDTIALDIGSFFEPEQINEGLIQVKDALQALNEEGSVYYTVGVLEITMEAD